ncbi:MAG: GNAT family N-acetyltransferase [Butyrivibrio sp.]|nr:GNAT family N-acetyltransferase [Butyrivibrio sp.]
MLKKVAFVIDEENLKNEEVKESLESAKEYIEQCGTEAVILGAQDFFTTYKSDNEMLVIADTKETTVKATELGFYVVGIEHSLNKNEDFPGVKYIFSDIEEVDMDSFVKAYQRYANEPWEVLTTERLLVRETTLDDVDEFYKLYKDPEMTKYMEGLFENPEDEKRYQKDYIEKVYGLMGFGVWTLVRRKDNKVIGRVGYSVRNGFEDIELGFLIGKEYQRQGYAFEACKAVLDYGRDILLFDKVQTLVKAENEISINLCKKLGFKYFDTVSVEEDIYGREYVGEKIEPVGGPTYGEYVRLMLKFE